MAVGTIACIDIGSSKICTIIANVADKRIDSILGVGEVASRGVQKGIIVDMDDASMMIRESVERAQSATAPKVGWALAGFSGKHISSTNPMVSVDTSRKDHLVTESAIGEAKSKLEAIVFPEDRVRLNMVGRQYAIDRVGGIRNPLGMHGFRLDLEAHIVTADYGYMQNLLECLRRAGVAVSLGSLVANPLASAEAVLEPEDKERGVIVADIGGGTTGIAVFREGSIWHTSVLPVGGRNVTNDLAIGLNIPFSGAEELKVAGGGLYPERVDASRIEVIEKYKTTPEELSYMIRARVEEILRMIQSKTPYVPNILVLTGGTAKLPGMEQFAREELGLQARIGRARVLPEDSKGLDDPAYAAGVGLLLWGAKSEELGGRVELGGGLTRFTSGLGSLWQSIWSRRPKLSFGGPTTEES